MHWWLQSAESTRRVIWWSGRTLTIFASTLQMHPRADTPHAGRRAPPRCRCGWRKHLWYPNWQNATP